MDIYMICPVRGCGLRQAVSHEDPDASQSELWNHFGYRHPGQDGHTLLAEAKVVNGQGRILTDVEVREWMFAPASS